MGSHKEADRRLPTADDGALIYDDAAPMTSSFTWLAHSRREREQTLEVLSRLSEQEVREEFGLGAIRDAFSDLLFPGLSTIQTRAAYFLLVPWCYQEVARSRNRHRSVARQARDVEVELINALVDHGERDGVIGQRARSSLQRLPSEVYWNGLLVLGVLREPDARSAVHARAQAAGRRDIDVLRGVWDGNLPAPPDGFPERATLDLRPDDASYLRDRVVLRAPTSLLGHLLLHEQDVDGIEAPWELADDALPPGLRELLEHARLFSLATHGAALLYNLMLAEDGWDDLRDVYTDELAAWTDEVEMERDALQRWDRQAMWRHVLLDAGANVTARTRSFADTWLDLVLADAAGAAGGDHARTLLRERERLLKGGAARLFNARAREQWGGSSGAARLTYRWRTASRIATDIVEGLRAPAV